MVGSVNIRSCNSSQQQLTGDRTITVLKLRTKRERLQLAIQVYKSQAVTSRLAANFDDLRGEQVLIKEQFMIGKIGCEQPRL